MSVFHQACLRLLALLTASFRACFSAKAFSSLLLRFVRSQLAEAAKGWLGMGTIIRKDPAEINAAFVPHMQL